MQWDNVVVKKAAPADLELVFSICRRSYAENFANHWKPTGLDWYFDKVYSRIGIEAELNTPDVNYFVAFADNEPIGYIKLNFHSALAEIPAKDAMEIEKIYFLPSFQGRGIGNKLISLALELARKRSKSWVWLGVLASNEKARMFYTNTGFAIHDKVTLPFPLLKEEHRDMWRMKIKLDGSLKT
jgi:ribosomal protein S18 acetylase RimI-like enzyme